MDSQLLVSNHTMILNVREGRVLEGEGREMFENLSTEKDDSPANYLLKKSYMLITIVIHM